MKNIRSVDNIPGTILSPWKCVKYGEGSAPKGFGTESEKYNTGYFLNWKESNKTETLQVSRSC
jgi:hypothetical protein